MLKIECSERGKKLEAIVDNDIQRFEDYFVKLDNSLGAPLSNSEIAIIKTYLYYKVVLCDTRTAEMDGETKSNG